MGRFAKYPKHCDYELLYARYFQRKPEELLALVGPLAGKRVLDLCGGNGRASIAALKMGAKECLLVDRSLDMVPDDLDSRIQVENAHVCAAFRRINEPFDIAVCQQGINYWFEEPAIDLLKDAIRPGGIFIFNTFNQKPPVVPMVKEYEYEGRHYVEISWLVTEFRPTVVPRKGEFRSTTEHVFTEYKVHHVQICEGHEPHTTVFDWIPAEEFHRVLQPWFEVQEVRFGKTSIYKCVRRDGKFDQ